MRQLPSARISHNTFNTYYLANRNFFQPYLYPLTTIMMKTILTIAIAILLCYQGNTQTLTTAKVQQYPVIPGDLPDPSILRVGNRYYATGTSSEWSPQYPLYTSEDLLHWKQQGFAFPKTPAWAVSSYWAPELYYRKGTYYVYYCARRTADGIVCIGVATSKDPLKGFTDHGVLLQWGKEAIDPFMIEDSGKLYMSFKAYGLDSRPIELLCVPLSDDGLKVTGEAFSLLRDDERKGLEGQCMVKRNDGYYLFYSYGACCGRECSYEVGVAKATALKGPYTKYEGNPVVTESNTWKCTGHGTVTTTKDGRYVYLYHAYNKKDNVYTGRQAMLSEVTWNKETGWPNIKPVNGLKPANLYNDFSGNNIGAEWMWDAKHSQSKVKIENGRLHLSGMVAKDNESGTVLTVRAYEGNYNMTVKVLSSGDAGLSGLTVYGDIGACAGIGMQKDSIVVWEVKDGKRKILQQVPVAKLPVYLKIETKDGYKMRFFWSASTDKWTEVKLAGEYYDGSYLPQWDRSPRPGIIVKDGEGVLDDFRLDYVQ